MRTATGLRLLRAMSQLGDRVPSYLQADAKRADQAARTDHHRSEAAAMQSRATVR